MLYYLFGVYKCYTICLGYTKGMSFEIRLNEDSWFDVCLAIIMKMTK